MAFSFDPTASAFNRANALYLAHASDVAYHRAPSGAARQRLGLKAIPFRNKITRTRGFLGVCDTHAVLSFRGSDPITLPNWITDAVVRLVQCAEYEGKVHRGFSSVLHRTWRKVEALLDEVQDRPLFLTGHSMGGALAVLTACRLANMGRPPVAVYTFGSPRVGDPVFCGGYALPTYRIVNRMDLVPEMPLASVKKLLPKKLRFTNEKLHGRLTEIADRIPCYDHVKTFVHIDRDGVITTDADVHPWHTHAVAVALATRGKSFLEGLTDHLIANYIRSLEGRVTRKHATLRRRIRVD